MDIIFYIGIFLFIIGAWQAFMRGTYSEVISGISLTLGMILVFVGNWRIGLFFIFLFVIWFLLMQLFRFSTESKRIKELVDLYHRLREKGEDEQTALIAVAGEYRMDDGEKLGQRENYSHPSYAKQVIKVIFNKSVEELDLKKLLRLIITMEFSKYNRMRTYEEIRSRNDQWDKLEKKIEEQIDNYIKK